MNKESRLLIGALRAAVTGKQIQLDTAVDWPAFLLLAAAHKVEGLVWSALKEQALPEEVAQRLSLSFNRAIFADAQLEHTKAQLQAALSRAGVDHVFLKGAVLKHDYPVPALRTMSDMDILVYTRQYPQLDAACQKLGGKLLEGDGNHRNFLFPGGVKVEFHPNILHHSAPVAAGVNPGWQYVRQGQMTPEGHYLSVLCHLTDHFVTGGIGVRFVLDVWVLQNLWKGDPDRAFIEKELNRFGILEFVRNIEALAEAWFGDGKLTPLLEELGEYILTSGSHGTAQRQILNAVSLSGGGRAKALWQKVFYPRQELEDRFPWCKGRPLLLPAAWLKRVFRAVTRRSDLIRHWTKQTGSITREEARQQRELLRRFGI